MRTDAFETYRRVLCGHAAAEMDAGGFYRVSWPARMVHSRRRWIDLLVQVIIYVSFDFFPLLVAYRSFGQPSFIDDVVAMLMVVAATHVASFFMCWNVSDVVVKVQAFFGTASSARGENGRATIRVHEDPISRCKSLPITVSQKSDKGHVADELNLCVLLCSWLQMPLPHFMWIGFLIVGVSTGQKWMSILGVVAAPFCICYSYRSIFHGRTNRYPRLLCNGSERMWALQSWGEAYCGMGEKASLEARIMVGCLLLFQCVIMFAIPTWTSWSAMCICAGMITYNAVRQLHIRRERPWGWALNVCEGFLVGLMTTALNAYYFSGLLSWGHVAFVFCCVCFRQFGLARSCQVAERLVRVLRILLIIAILLISWATLLSLRFRNSPGAYTSFCRDKGCAFWEVPEATGNTSIMCKAWQMTHDHRIGSSFTLGDFGLLSLLAYAPPDHLEEDLRFFFPGWRVLSSHIATSSKDLKANYDWTTFFEFSNAQNSVGVVAVRGTRSALDNLSDLNIWRPAVVMELLKIVGPGVSNSLELIIAVLLRLWCGGGSCRAYDKELQAYVEDAVQRSPSKRYYLTGHSLGGGLAKLVGAKVSVPAVTWMAPGLRFTSHQLHATDLSDKFGVYSLTVEPSDDIISNFVDDSMGTVVPMPCHLGPLRCHLLEAPLCEGFATCGSSRGPDLPPLKIPCAWCPEKCKGPEHR
eukprot:TRINITY_DN106735_c0_g1_i1.p1 TRINITY_DN106735_c0_g1~~TRINITY_DN106735_c0_g1_i1.p1  ORF type:complete len:803 (-),score=119.02 TRINITY_DN106735_c0_g1_i1:7-2094(-)